VNLSLGTVWWQMQGKDTVSLTQLSSSIKGRQVMPCQITQACFPTRSIYFTHREEFATPPAPCPLSTELCGAASLTAKFSHLLKWSKAGPAAIPGQAQLPHGVLHPSVPPPDTQEQDAGESLEAQHTCRRSVCPRAPTHLAVGNSRPGISQLGLALECLFAVVLPLAYPAAGKLPSLPVRRMG